MANSHMTFGVDLLPRTTNTYNLGNSNQKWNVWINQINGYTPITSGLLVSTTQLTNAATAATETANRVYPVALDANGKLAVNVPWTGGSEISSSDVITALGYTPYNSSNPMGYTSNVGTITGITMNGASKGTSGVVDLGTVITDVSDKVSGPATATATHVATFSDTTGKVIQDSGYTIGTSVPSNAVFTDTTTSVSYSTTPASVNVSTTGATGSIVLGEAAAKQVDSTVTSSSTNLPTSAAVATYVQQNTGSADWADIIDSSVDTTDVDYTEGSEYLYNHIRPSNTDTIIGNNVTVTNSGYVTATNVTASQVNVEGTGAVWQWIPTSTGLELVCAPTT